MHADARARLLERQTALLRNLLRGEPPPAGLDAERLLKVAATLHAKRSRLLQSTLARTATESSFWRLLRRLFRRT